MDSNSLNPPAIEKRLLHYNTLYENDLYLDILTDSKQHYGDYQQWTNPVLLILAARCLRQLGLYRKSDAIFLRLWRKKVTAPFLMRNYLDVVRRRQGPLQALALTRHLLQDDNLSAHDRAYLLCDQSDVMCFFRDFASAETLLQQAQAVYSDRWIDLQTAYLDLEQDKYQTAIIHSKRVCADHKNYRPALQLLAHLLQLSGEVTQAIALLQPLLHSMQSYSLCMQLFNFNIEAGDFEQAQCSLARAESLHFEKSATLEKEINGAKADLFCAQQRYEEALPLLEQKNFFRQSVLDSIRSATDQHARKVLDLPFIRQHHMTCAPASLSSVSTYWGRPISQDEVVEAICYDGTPAVDERRWLEQQGWHVVEFQLQFDTVKALIDQDIPLLLSTVEPGSAHLQIVVGYDQTMGTYLMRDPYHPRLQEMLISGAQAYYAASGPRCTLMLPPEKKSLLADVHFEASALYDSLFTLNSALDNHQREQAYVALRDMIDLDPDHRLTLTAHRTLSMYDQDERAILKYTEKLLQLFPDDVNLQLSKVSSLGALVSSQEHLAYLESLNKNPQCHFLIKSRLVDSLRFDHRQQLRTEKMLHSLLKTNSAHPPTLYAYAGVLWDKGEYQQSYEIYRFVTCLEDKVESYAQSYFKAARYFKKATLAIEFLTDRFQRFAAKSSGPAISLFNAYDALDKTRQGLGYLDLAIEKRPDDGDLLLYAAQEYLLSGDIDKCVALTKQAKSKSNVTRFLELSAMIAEWQKDRNQAIACWDQVLAYEPLNGRANNGKIRLMTESGRREDAQAFIDVQLKQFPQNYNLLCSKVRCLADSDINARIAVYELLIKNHADENLAYKGIAAELLQRGNFDQAEHYAREATKVNQTDAAAYTQLGHVLFAQQNVEEARQAFRRAIEISCDHTDAFEPLMQCVLSYDSERAELSFIYDQLMKQVSFGGGILHYQQLAQRWLDASELQTFLVKSVAERPDLWQAWRALANVYSDQGMLEQAYTTLEKGLENFPLVPDLYFAKAQLLRLMNRQQEAQEQLLEALTIAPGWVTAVNALSEILEMQGEFEQAINHLRSVITRTPMAASPYGYLASLLWRIDQKEEAINEMHKAIELDPEYEWAWLELKNWCDELERSEQLIELIEKARQQMPNNSRFIRLEAKLHHNQQRKCEILEGYLQTHPQAIDICTDYVRVLVEMKQYQRALTICEDSRWHNDAPLEIKALRAWILNCDDKADQAIAEMRWVVAKNPNYYDGWRLLAIWYDDLSDHKQVVECVDHCSRLYPNVASVLTFVAEKLQAHGEDQADRISELLHRAFHLDPTDTYTGLTYLDDLIEKENYPQAKTELQLLKVHINDAYVYYRELQLASAEQDNSNALLLWQKIIQDPQANSYIVNNSWDVICKLQCQTQAITLVETLRSEGQYVAEHVGECFGYYSIEQQGCKKFAKTLLSISSKDAYFNRMIEALLQELIKEGTKPPAYINSLKPFIVEDTTNWGLLGYLYGSQDLWVETREWLKNYQDKKKIEAWMLYFYSLSLREAEQWQTATMVMAEALELAHDNYRDDIVIWSSLDKLLSNQAIDEARIHRIDEPNLAGLTVYPLKIIQALVALEGKTFVDGYAQISPKLRECQREYQSVIGSSAVLGAKNRCRQLLKVGIDRPFFKKMFWLWRLSNHF